MNAFAVFVAALFAHALPPPAPAPKEHQVPMLLFATSSLSTERHGYSQELYTLPIVDADKPMTLLAEGRGTDIDCYVLGKNKAGKGYTILAKDEKMHDTCSITVYPRTTGPVRIWIVNHGYAPTVMNVIVRQ